MEIKIVALQKVMLHYGKKRLFWSLIIFGCLSFITVRGQKISVNSCAFIKFLNFANFHAFHVWGKRISSCNDTTLSFTFIPFIVHFYSICFCNATFFHSGYVIKPPQPSSAIYRALPFTGNHSIQYMVQHCIALFYCTKCRFEMPAHTLVTKTGHKVNNRQAKYRTYSNEKESSGT